MKVTLHFDLNDPAATGWLERLTEGLTNKQPSNQSSFFKRLIQSVYAGASALIKAFNRATETDEPAANTQGKPVEQLQSTETQPDETTAQL